MSGKSTPFVLLADLDACETPGMGAIRIGPAFVPSRSGPRRPSSCSCRAGTRPARSTARAASGWTGTSRAASGSWPRRRASRSRCTRRSPRSSAIAALQEAADGGGHARPLRRSRSCGAAPVVFHPGFLLGRERDDAIVAVVEQLGELRERLAAKDRTCRSASRSWAGCGSSARSTTWWRSRRGSGCAR